MGRLRITREDAMVSEGELCNLNTFNTAYRLMLNDVIINLMKMKADQST